MRYDKSSVRQRHGVIKVHMMPACMRAQGRQAHGCMQILLLFMGMGRASSKSFFFFYGNSIMHVRRA